MNIKKYNTQEKEFKPVELRLWNDHLVITANNQEGFQIINKDKQTALEAYGVTQQFYAWTKEAENELYFCTMAKLSYDSIQNTFEFTESPLLESRGKRIAQRESIYLGNNKWFSPSIRSWNLIDSKEGILKNIRNINFNSTSILSTLSLIHI